MASRQPSRPRQQKRKRKVETKTNDKSSGINYNEDTSHDVVVAKRPCQRRRRENFANLNSSRQVHSAGVESRQGTSTPLNADMISQQTISKKSIPASSSTSSVNRKASSILQRMRCSNHDNTVQNDVNNNIHSTATEEEASSDGESDTTRSDVSNCNEITSHNTTNTKDKEDITAMSDNKQKPNYITYIREKRKLQYMILTLVTFGTMLLTILSATIYLQHSNHNLIILEKDAITSQTTQQQLEHTNKRHNTQMKTLTQINNALKRDYDEINTDIKHMSMQYNLLKHNHIELANIYLAPILNHTNKIQQSYEEQHSIILDLMKSVQSLQSSLTSCKEDIETQKQESINAVEAVAHASNQFALVKAHEHELERSNYIEHMELTIDRIEDEAIGAVHAVATAAGKLEYERKLEEEERWQRYTKEAESILGSIQTNVQGDDTNAKSVLRAAISRRIEEGLISLRSYVYPYNYLKRREDSVITNVEED